MTDQDRAVATIQSLRELGVRISIDDHGTGYSSIAYLRRLAADEVKIDRSFVSGLWSDADAEAIVRATLDLAHVLGVEVVAEGVEDTRTREFLSALGIERPPGIRDRAPHGCGSHRPVGAREERGGRRGLRPAVCG